VEAALRYSAAHPIDCILVGCSTVPQVERDVAALRGEQALTEADRQEMERLVTELGDLFCRRCRYCERGCPEGVPISDIFRCHDYLVLNQTYAREEYRRLVGHDRECAECGSCEAICPYGLPVREMLRVAHGELRRKSWMDAAMRVLHATGTYDIVRRAFFRLGGPRFLPKHRYLHAKDLRRRHPP
jgi:predicted aldo/keto reductase-like oxidoreductase